MRVAWHKNLMGRWQGVLVAGALMAAPFSAQAAVPSTMSIEGSLYSSGGGPAADGNYNIVFSVYKDAVGGNPVYAEGPVVVNVKNGLFSYVVGSKTPLTASTLASLPTAFLAMKIESDPELTRQQLSSAPYALRASIAEGVDCSGCITAGNLDPNVLGAYAKSSTLSKVATSGAYADLTGSPTLAKVATSGAFADLTGGPDLSAYAKLANLAAYTKTAGLAKVALTGNYVDLNGEPTVTLAFGSSCGTGLAVKGIKSDGTLDCVAAGSGPVDPKNLPADGIDEISNKLIYNQFVDSVAGGTGIGIPDNNPVGVSDTITFPDIGTAQKLTITVDISNSDLSKLSVSAFDPNNVEYVLYDKGSTGGSLVTSYPDPTTPVKGDLTTWIGKNPAGKWYLKVVDSGFLNNATDGKINKWSINLSTLSSKKIAIAGNLIVSGDLTVSGVINGGPWPVLRWGRFSTYDYNGAWYYNNTNTWTLGIAPSTWTDGSARIWQIANDKNYWRTVLTNTMKIYPTMTVMSEAWYDPSSTNGKVLVVLFRVKNSTASPINWSPAFWHTNYGGWSECSSATVNGAGTWENCGTCYAWNCQSQPTFAIPANRTSSVMFTIQSGPAGSGMRSQLFTFYSDTLKLPAGLEYVDDLDTSTGGWEK
jgi:subtilisin-like proprotein convertase family protein